MIDLVVIILVEVQANELISTSFHPSSLRIMFPRPSKLDSEKTIFHTCLEAAIEISEENLDEKYRVWCFTSYH